MPPVMISAQITRLTSGLAAYAVREEKGASFPHKSNPALQNAETEWNTA